MGERLNVFPSRMVLTALKERAVAAKTGHSLLKRKSDAIKANLNNILKEILDVCSMATPMAMAMADETSHPTTAHTNAVLTD
jgi:vacuolar-type H+-ATPase subunit D/Vma8